MNPCLADTGSTVSVPLIVVAVVVVLAGAALYLAARRKKKSAAGTTTLTLVLFGALMLGGMPSAPAHADPVGNQCGQAAAPVQTPTQTPTPTTTPTPTSVPTPTCTPAELNDTVQRWSPNEGDGGVVVDGVVTDSALRAALAGGTTYNGHVVLVVRGATVFDGPVTFTASADGAGVALAVAASAYNDDLASGGTITLTFQIPGSSADCPTHVTVTGPVEIIG
ncbi:hypothetical protein GCM10028798_01510 [Humibacter antri]